MSGALRRGACPSLSAPMPTGDGLLVRLNPKCGSLTARQLAGVADATAEFGNGILEITSRGSLQCRGLRRDTVDGFALAVAALRIEADDAPEVRVPPLAGLDAGELSDPRPLAQRLRAEIARRDLAPRLAPKLSIAIDSGGALNLAGLQADVRLEAQLGSGRWLVLVGGSASTARMLGSGSAETVLAAVLGVLEHIAAAGTAARGRDLTAADLADLGRDLRPASASPVRIPATAVGVFALRGGAFARGFALPFHQIASAEIAAFAASIDSETEIRLAPGGALLVLGQPQAARDEFAGRAETFGLVTTSGDPRLRLFACAGSPSCASSHLPTKALARALVAQCPELLADLPKLHISGCPKQCAKPAGPVVSLIGAVDGIEVVADAVAVPAILRRQLKAMASSHSKQGISA